MDLSEDQIRGLPHHELLGHFLQMREEFNEFQTSSAEIEKMMDSELDDLKTQLKKAETRVQQMTTEQIRNKVGTIFYIKIEKKNFIKFFNYNLNFVNFKGSTGRFPCTICTSRRAIKTRKLTSS